MRLRLRLALAFLLLSALPLAALALYSYRASSLAVRRAAQAEAELMARELELRVESVASDVDQRVRALARLPSQYWTSDRVESADAGESKVLSDFAGALPFLEGLQFVPAAPAPPDPTAALAHPAPPATVAGVEPRSIVFAMPTSASGERIEMEVVRREFEKVKEVVARAIHQTAAGAGAGSARVGPGLDKQLVLIQQREANLQELAPRLEAQARATGERGARNDDADAMPVAGSATRANAAYPSDVSCSVQAGDQIVGKLTAKIRAKELLRSVLRQTDRAEGEIPFAIDESSTLFVAESDDGERLRSLPAIAALKSGAPAPARATGEDWVVVTRTDPATGYRFGIARPISRALGELKATTARNFAYGIGLVGLALVGMVPLSTGLLKNVRALEQGAVRIAAGDLTTRVPVRTKDEFGRLALSFNRMAEQLSENQERLLQEERLRKETGDRAGAAHRRERTAREGARRSAAIPTLASAQGAAAARRVRHRRRNDHRDRGGRRLLRLPRVLRRQPRAGHRRRHRPWPGGRNDGDGHQESLYRRGLGGRALRLSRPRH